MPQPEQPSHIQWILQNLGLQLEQASLGEGVQASAANIVATITAADPSPHFLFSDWLAKTYIAGGYRLEDLKGGAASKVAETLEEWTRSRTRLEDQNLYNYRSIAEVWQAVSLFREQEEQEIGSRQLRREERTQALAESTVVFRDNNLIVSIPHSKFASQWWGRGTRWCTAAKEFNAFGEYYTKSPLVVITLPRGLAGEQGYTGGALKFQLHVQSNQFCDENDAQVDNVFIQNNWNVFAPVLRWAAQQDPVFYQYFPRDQFREEMLLENDNPAFSHIYYYMDRVKISKSTWNSIAHKLDPSHILFILDKVLAKREITREMAQILLNHYGKEIERLPKRMLDEELCVQALGSGAGMCQIPERLRTRAVYLAAIKAQASYWSNLPDKYKEEPEFVKTLLMSNGFMLKKLPKRWQTDENVILAIKTTPEILKYDVIENYSDKIIAGIHSVADRCFHHLPKTSSLRTAEFIKKAVSMDGDLIQYLSSKQRTPELIELAISSVESKRNGAMPIRYLDAAEITPKICMEALKVDWRAIRFIPDYSKTPEMYSEVIEQENSFIYECDYLARENPELHKRLVLIAIKNCPNAIVELDSIALDNDFLSKAIEINPLITNYLEEKVCTNFGLLVTLIKPEWNQKILDNLAACFPQPCREQNLNNRNAP